MKKLSNTVDEIVFFVVNLITFGMTYILYVIIKKAIIDSKE